eukprot:gene2798-3052_t
MIRSEVAEVEAQVILHDYLAKILPTRQQQQQQQRECLSLQPFGMGQVNATWAVCLNDVAYFVLQQVNTTVLLDPAKTHHNYLRLQAYAQGRLSSSPVRQPGHDSHQLGGEKKPFPFLVVLPQSEEGFLRTSSGCLFRLFEYLPTSQTIRSPSSLDTIYEMARQFACFTAFFHDFPVSELEITIPALHDLTAKYATFEESLLFGREDRKANAEAQRLIALAIAHGSEICPLYSQLCHEPDMKQRVVHHDAKLSNMLFDNQGRGLAVIDLDTVMPGWILCDLGELLRATLCGYTSCEDAADLASLHLEMDCFQAVVRGYLEPLEDLLTAQEKVHLLFAGDYIIFMQAIRYLTDYLVGDVYYIVVQSEQNLIRARNLFWLLRAYQEKRELMQQIVNDILQ